jgi:hypothetical protein
MHLHENENDSTVFWLASKIWFQKLSRKGHCVSVMKSQNCYLTDRLCMGQDDLPKLLQVSPRKGIFHCKVTFFANIF